MGSLRLATLALFVVSLTGLAALADAANCKGESPAATAASPPVGVQTVR